MLFGVPPHDPSTYALVIVTIGSICLFACWLPALQASRVHAAAILRDA
jgi:ABC-type lipoprotein release transport system permease subunit